MGFGKEVGARPQINEVWRGSLCRRRCVARLPILVATRAGTRGAEKGGHNADACSWSGRESSADLTVFIPPRGVCGRGSRPGYTSDPVVYFRHGSPFGCRRTRVPRVSVVRITSDFGLGAGMAPLLSPGGGNKSVVPSVIAAYQLPSALEKRMQRQLQSRQRRRAKRGRQSRKHGGRDWAVRVARTLTVMHRASGTPVQPSSPLITKPSRRKAQLVISVAEGCPIKSELVRLVLLAIIYGQAGRQSACVLSTG